MLPIGIGGNTLPGYYLESSLRFRRSASGYLERTPSSSGTSSTQATWSMWVKLAQVQNNELGVLFEQGNTSNDRIFINVRGNGSTYPGSIQFGYGISASYRQIITNDNATLDGPKFVDPSAWYHLVCVLDTPNATQNDRMRIYVNGERQTITYSTLNLCVQSESTVVSSTNVMRIGSNSYSLSNNFDGYLTEYNFVDGQALTPSDFGETDTITGVWKPKEYTGTYGTNGFYLPMKETQQATGFNTVLYTGTSSTQSIANVGFSPDFIWIKRRSGANAHQLYDTVRGAGYVLKSDSTNAEAVETAFNSFDADGFEIDGGSGSHNLSGESYVAWCWDAGSSTVSNTDGSITSSVRANPASGFSIVTYTGNGSSGTVGHGLGSAPEMIIIKNRNQADGWYVWHQNNGAGIYGYLFLNSTDQVRSSTPQFGTTAPDSSVISLTYNTNDWANASGENYVAYCFSEVSGFSKFGSYTGNGSVGNSVTGLGFEPAFLLIKNATDLGGSGESWYLYDNARDPVDTRYHKLNPNGSSAESTSTVNNLVDFDSDGFTIQSTNAGLNYNGDTYIYMAFADTRDAQFNFDASGNKNNWTANNINSNASSETTYDIMNDVATLTDEDTANFCTLNPLSETSNLTTSNGNLTVANSTTETQHRLIRGTMGMSTGKYYWEINVNNSAFVDMVGIINSSYNGTDNTTVNASNGFGYGYSTSNGNWYAGGNWTNDGTTPSAFPSSGIIGVAFDADNGKLYFSRNNTWINSANPSAGTGANGTYTGSETEFLPAISIYNNTGAWNINFGQRPFKYTPPTGYKKLNTFNLPDSSITDGSEYMNPVLYTGDGVNGRSITGVGFNTNFLWIKDRSSANRHSLHDIIRGAGQRLISDGTDAESSTGSHPSFITDGFTIPSSTAYNSSGNSYVAWNWRGSDSSAVSNTDGTITSTVSANTTSGFSVVTYTATGNGNDTVGHGLGIAPKVVLLKSRSTTGDWIYYTTQIDGSLDYLYLNQTASKADSGWTAPSSTVFPPSNTTNGTTMVAYCFAEVEGFSQFGSYTGNGSADGPFVYTGFRPAFVMIKAYDTTSSWTMVDSQRNTYNVCDKYLVAQASDAEATTTIMDFTSNGFKIRYSNTKAWIYMAFAENPFKHSLAR